MKRKIYFLLMSILSFSSLSITVNSSELKNPIILQRADPWVYKHTDGYYYFSASVPQYDRIELRRSRTIQGLGKAAPVVVWKKHTSRAMSANIWAPEIHCINEKWYIYFAAARSTARFDHRIYVLENSSKNPLKGKWIEKGQLKTNWESFSLDATTFSHNGKNYLVWAQKDPKIHGNSNLYIAEMSSPYSIKDDQIMISKPEYDWEKIGFWVNEGAAVIKKNSRIFLTYSASATDFNYCMGLLIADESDDLLDPNSWSKSEKPIFKSNEETGQYGPGHNCFTVSEDGKDNILIYHARNYKEIIDDPLYDPNRHTRAQKLDWDSNGMPVFGIPVSDSK